MSDDEQVVIMVLCDWCDEKAHYRGTNVLCQQCWGKKLTPHVLNCKHEWSWVGYGTVDDPQWDGANQCEECDAIFALWPREVDYAARSK